MVKKKGVFGMQWGNYPSFTQVDVLGGDSIAGTASATDFATKLPIVANSLIIGNVIYVTAGGPYGTLAIGTRSLNLHVKLGGTTILSSGVRSPMAGAANNAWTFQGLLTTTRDGPGGFVNGHGVWTFYSNVLTGDDVWSAFSFGAAINTSVDMDLTLGCQWTNADALNSLGMTDFMAMIGVP